MINEQIFNVKNRSASLVVYKIPEENIRREFMPGETKKIPYGELERLTYQPGGRAIMENYLQIAAVEASEALGLKRELEYNMSENDVQDLILNGSLDSFLDCLDFAPIGVIELVKAMAVSLPMNDYEKINALREKTGFDVHKALRNIEEEKAETQVQEEAPKQRRVKEEPKRRVKETPKEDLDMTKIKVEVPDYKVVG